MDTQASSSPPVVHDSAANTHKVKVTLTAQNGDLSIAERILTFPNTGNIVQVGRASKSVTKGILGAPDNAWFDSPVMSRYHATIEYNTEDQTVTIQDIGSMHGTYLNDFELAKDSPAVIDDGDVLVFGAEVRRGSEIFPACSFRVSKQSFPYKAANTFAFPESSDVEEEGEENYDEFSEDDIEMQHRYSSEDGVSIDSAPRKLSQASEAIDLTGDDYPNVAPSNHIDLTGETEAERRMMTVMSGRPHDIDENADPTSIGVYAGNHPIVLDSEDDGEFDDSDSSSELGDHIEDNASVDSDVARMHAIFEDDSEEVSDSEEENDPFPDSDMDSDAGLDEEDQDVPMPAVSGLIRYAVATDENAITHLSDIRTRVELPASDDEDDESDFDLSEAGAEGMKAFYGATSAPPEDNALDWEDGNDNDVPSQVDEQPSQMILDSAADLDISASSASKNITGSAFEVKQQETLLRPFSIIRQPSPSDAAMVKSARRVSTCELGESGEYSPQALGEKSGKSAFFAAREVNKAKLGLNEQFGARSTIQAANRSAEAFLGPAKPRISDARSAPLGMSNPPISPFNTWIEPAVEMSSFAAADTMFSSFVPEPVETSMKTFVGSGKSGKLMGGQTNEKNSFAEDVNMPTRDFCSFLDKPDQSPMVHREISPLPDMTSSFSYNASKDSMISAPVSQHNARSAIKITDIVDSSSAATRANGLKRKSEVISNVTDKELRNWANSNVSSKLPTTSTSAPVVGDQSIGASGVSDAGPPPKRFKKLLEKAGYVALGGATLFAALVASAPDLI